MAEKQTIDEQRNALSLEREALELEELKERRKEKQERLQQENAVRLANAENARKAIADQLRAQELCLHLKENGKTNIMGQRVHSGPGKKYMYTFVCLRCNKEFNELTIPSMLRPDPALVGGPDV